MYLGQVVEVAPTEAPFLSPNHPYTRGLIAEIPRIVTGPRKFSPMQGEIPSPLDPPRGCHFHPRCPFATARCKLEAPQLRQVAAERWSACHLNDGYGAPIRGPSTTTDDIAHPPTRSSDAPASPSRPPDA
jgi:peptide/nickel transport system ATP-binding protein